MPTTAQHGGRWFADTCVTCCLSPVIMADLEAKAPSTCQIKGFYDIGQVALHSNLLTPERYRLYW